MASPSQAAKPRRRSKRPVVLALIALAAYGLLMIFGGCADRLLLYPSQQPVDARGLSRLEVAAPSGGVEVWTTRTVVADRPIDAYVLHFIGNASRAEYEAQGLADDWAGNSVEIWAVNYPGYGQSTGPAKLNKIAPAALTVYDALAKRAGSTPIILSGRSLGATAALYLAARRPAAGLVLQNPPPLQRLILQHYGWWNLWLVAGPVALQVPADLNSLRNAPLAKMPAVFVLAEKDTIVPPSYAQMVVGAFGGPKKTVTILGADHNDDLAGQSLQQFRDGIHWLLSQTIR
jgi:pimeloyl-ACP methyl ester carboxylesterase